MQARTAISVALAVGLAVTPAAFAQRASGHHASRGARGNASATLADIQPGDQLVVVWSAPPGTAALNLPDAARVYDFGQPSS
jgi:hypothetical protein